MIIIVDYGMGNLRSVAKALEHLGAQVRVTDDPAQVAGAKKLVLPGVGAFDAAMEELKTRRLIEPLSTAIRGGVPYLGICLGLQLLFEDSEEGRCQGLGILRGRVRRFPDDAKLKIPHMGWNQVTRSQKAPPTGLADPPRSVAEEGRRQNGCPLLKEIPEGGFFYFVHSYYADPADRSLVALEADYGVPFAAMVWRGNIYATQFHPEKSQALGLKFLQNFIER